MSYRFTIWHSTLYLLAQLALAVCFLIHQANDPYSPLEGRDFLLALLTILFGGGAEATALWLFARQRMLHPTALAAASLLLDLLILLPFALLLAIPLWCSAQPEATARCLGIYALASHPLWVVAAAIAQKHCRRTTPTATSTPNSPPSS